MTTAKSAGFRPTIERLEDRSLLAAIPQLLADINSVTAGSDPAEFVETGGILYFTAEEGFYNRELWRSDGTAAGTYAVTNLNQESGGSPRHLAASGGRVFFTALTNDAPWELWTTDGTTDGTRMVKDIWPDGYSFPEQLTDVAGTLFFTADDGETGRELWKSDGTAEGTVRVADLIPGIQSSYIQEMVAVGGTLYFTADDPAHYGTQLWKSDGTEAGTVIVRHSSDGPISPQSLTAVGNRVFFRAHSNPHNLELWVSDGTAAGTKMVRDITPGTEHTPIVEMAAVGDNLYFVADDGVHGRELWTSDGTTAGTVLVMDMQPGSLGSYPTELTEFAGALYFTGGGPNIGFGLLRSEGTPETTVLIKEIIHPGGDVFGSPDALTVVGERLFFFADDGIHGRELWTSDGTEDGTTLVGDIKPNGSIYDRDIRLGVGDRLFFVADDGAHGTELWSSDGTESGTELVKDIRTDTLGSNPSALINLGNHVYFFADDGAHGSELWRTDGTTSGTMLVKDIDVGRNGSVPSGGGNLTVFNGRLYFNACDAATGCELWASDGGEVGTMRVKDIVPGADSGYPTLLTPVGNQLYFVANGQLWRTDGTEPGTTPVPGVPSGVLFDLTDVDGKLMFVALDDQNDLWKTDGTSEGTLLVKANIPGLYPFGSPTVRSVVDGLLYFTTFGVQSQLWRSDGTTDGTFPLAQIIHSGFDSFANGSLTALDDEIYFIGSTPTASGLLKTDGTPDGTVLVKNFTPEDGRYVRSLVGTAGDAVFFIAVDSQGTHEVWKTDGTTDGTTRVHATRLALNDTIIVLVDTVVDDQIVVGMAGESGFHGLCHWGGPTLGGTNVSPAQESCRSITPWSVHSAGDKLFFTYNDGVHGTELWVQQSTPSGDFDDDNDVDAADIDRLAAEIRAGTHDAAFDVSNDGQVNFMDLAQLVTGILGSQLGDTNLDRSVDRRDVAALVANFGRTDAPGWSGGDLDGDGRIDARDLAILQSNLTPPVAPAAPGAVRATVAMRSVNSQRAAAATPRPAPSEPAEKPRRTLAAMPHRARALTAVAVDTAHTEVAPQLAANRRLPTVRRR
jgi:ELWxxDGT repeat protein